MDVWTYTCINWLHTLPYGRAWAEEYKAKAWSWSACIPRNLSSRRISTTMRRAVKAMRIAYPVAVDSNYGVWRAFSSNAWPAVYLLDAQGRVRFRHLGEGEYECTERMIHQLLAEAAGARVKIAERLRDAVVQQVTRMHALLQPEQRQRLAFLLRSGALEL